MAASDAADVFGSNMTKKVQKMSDDIQTSMTRVMAAAGNKLWTAQHTKQMQDRLMTVMKDINKANIKGDKDRADILQKRLESMSIEIANPKGLRDLAKGVATASESFGEGLHNAMQSVASKDVGIFATMFKKAGAMASKAGANMQTTTAKGATGAGIENLGKFLSSIGPLVMGIAAMAGGLAALVKVVLDSDARFKEFNKNILSSGLSISDLADNADDVSGSLHKVRDAFLGTKAASDFFQKWGVEAKDNLAIMGKFIEAGINVKKITGLSSDGLQGLNEQAIIFGKLLGETNEKIATDMADMSKEVGQSLTGIRDRFSDIYDAAKDSGFGVKRFYGMVLQLTSGLSMYNVRLDETLGMLSALGKIMDPKKAQEMVGSLGKGFKETGTKDRLVTGMKMGGKDLASLNKDSARNAAEAFQKTSGKGDDADAIADALTKAGFNPKGSSEDFAKHASEMTQKQTDELQASLNGIRATLGTQFADMQTASLGLKGGRGNQTAAMTEYSPEQMIKQTLTATKAITGARTDQLNKADLLKQIAQEEVGGHSKAEIDAANKVAREAKGAQGIGKNVAATGTADDIRSFNETMGKRFGMLIDQNKQLVDASDNNVKLSGDDDETLFKLLHNMFQTDAEKSQKTVDEAASEQKAKFEEQQRVASEVANATISMSDRLGGVIENLLASIDNGVQWIAGFFGSGKDDAKDNRRVASENVTKEIDHLRQAIDSMGNSPEDKASRKVAETRIKRLHGVQQAIRGDAGTGSVDEVRQRAEFSSLTPEQQESLHAKKIDARDKIYGNDPDELKKHSVGVASLNAKVQKKFMEDLDKKNLEKQKRQDEKLNEKLAKDTNEPIVNTLKDQSIANGIAKNLQDEFGVDPAKAAELAQTIQGNGVGGSASDQRTIQAYHQKHDAHDGLLTMESGGRRELIKVDSEDSISIHKPGGGFSRGGGGGNITVQVNQWGDVPKAVETALRTLRI